MLNCCPQGVYGRSDLWYQPAFVFPQNLGPNYAKYIWEAGEITTCSVAGWAALVAMLTMENRVSCSTPGFCLLVALYIATQR